MSPMKPATLILLSLFLFAACAAPTPTPVATATAQATAQQVTVEATQTSPPATATLQPTSPPMPTPTPLPELTQLTHGGCCTQPFWSQDSRQVMYLDKPDANSPTGIYAVNVETGGPAKLVTERIASYTPDMRYAISYDGSFTVLERLADHLQWRINTGRRGILLSPDRLNVIWNLTAQTYPFENRRTSVMLSQLGDGGQVTAPRRVTELLRGSALAWVGNGRLLMSGRIKSDSLTVTLFVYDLASGNTTNLASSERLRSISVAPGGQWVAYTIAFDTQPENNGTWVIRTDGESPVKLPLFGSFQWRGPARMILVPLEENAASHRVYEYDGGSGTVSPLTDPAVTVFKIANGDWALSPDGRMIVFVNAADSNLWMLRLPAD